MRQGGIAVEGMEDQSNMEERIELPPIPIDAHAEMGVNTRPSEKYHVRKGVRELTVHTLAPRRAVSTP